MNIILISPNRIVHNHWQKAIDSYINIYDEDEIKRFDFSENDIILFDLDNLEEYLNYLLPSKIVCLTSKLNNTKGFRLLKQGVSAYGNTYMTPLNLKNVINTVKDNKIWVHPELMSFIIQNSTLNNKNLENKKIDELSPRELEVSKLVAKGLSNKEIADNLNITERTVKAHISSIFTKLEIKDRVTLGIIIKESLD